MKFFKVTFRWSDTDTWCSNIAMAETEDEVREHYKKYGGDPIISAARDWEVDEAKRKGMPIVSCAV